MVTTLEWCMDVIERINQKLQRWYREASTRETTIAELAGRENLLAALREIADIIDAINDMDTQNPEVRKVRELAITVYGIIVSHLYSH